MTTNKELKNPNPNTIPENDKISRPTLTLLRSPTPVKRSNLFLNPRFTTANPKTPKQQKPIFTKLNTTHNVPTFYKHKPQQMQLLATKCNILT